MLSRFFMKQTILCVSDLKNSHVVLSVLDVADLSMLLSVLSELLI